MVLALAACAGHPPEGGRHGEVYPVPTYTGLERFVWCVPYARQISGVALHGDADTWWGQAARRYQRGTRPAPYAVLVLKPTGRLSDGHIGVVTGIIGPREIRVSHANWGWNSATRGRIYTHMPAIDVSVNNDWSEIRFKHPDVGAFGRIYPAYGFIYSPKDPDLRLAQSAPGPRQQPIPVAAGPQPPPPSLSSPSATFVPVTARRVLSAQPAPSPTLGAAAVNARVALRLF